MKTVKEIIILNIRIVNMDKFLITKDKNNLFVLDGF